jgi:anti-anti-sigma factor
MEHQLSDHGLVTILRLKGDLTFQDIETLGNLLHQTVQETNGEIVVDLAHVGYADSSVTGQFVAAKREAEVKRKQLVLSNLSPTVKKVLRTGHADIQVPLYDSTEEAIADLADRGRGGEPRKVVRNIRCGHEDCVFYTYTKTDFNVVPACQYPYPEEITNGPNCRCYRVNWKDLRGLTPDEDSPFRRGFKKDSPYQIRDSFRESPPPQPKVVEPDYELEPGFTHVDTAEVTLSEDRTSGFESDRSRFPSLGPTSTQSADWDFSTGKVPDDGVILDDPFADTNFPSSTQGTGGEPPLRMEPAPPPAPPKKKKAKAAPPPLEPPEPVAEEEVPDQPELPVEAPEQQPAPTAAVRVEPEPLTPMEVVRNFVEAWNDGNFAAEYDLLSSQSKAFDREDYCSRRRALRNVQFEKYGRATKQGIAEEDGHSIQQNLASVEITRLDRTPKGVRCYAQHYKLAHEDGHWKIQNVRDGESRRNPTAPPKGRKLNASQFFGKSKDIKGKPPTF